MSDDDEILWGMFTKDIQKIPKPPVLPPVLEGATKRPAVIVKKKSSNPVDIAPNPPPAVAQGTDLDRRTEDRFLSGKMPIDARLDLHGMTQAQAHRALSFFIAEALEKGRRNVLVITGKGRGGAAALDTEAADWLSPKPGVLRQNLPRWLDAPGIKEHILKIAPARPQHGGNGAFYVYLRRQRSPTIPGPH